MYFCHFIFFPILFLLIFIFILFNFISITSTSNLFQLVDKATFLI